MNEEEAEKIKPVISDETIDIMKKAEIEKIKANVVKVIDAVRHANADIDDYCFVFNRNHGTSKSFFDLGIKIHSLVEMSDDFIIAALKNENITGSEYEIFKDCVENPVEWSRNYILKNPDYLKKRLAEVITNGRVNSKAPLEVITIGHPELMKDFGPMINKWLAELGVRHDVPAFNYKVSERTDA